MTTRNRKALLDTIAYAEGTDVPGNQRTATKNHGYDVIVGGAIFTDYKDHPRVVVNLPRYNIKSSAAGRYQFIRRTWDALRDRLKLPDFGPESQDRAATELLRECGALAHIDAGKFEHAIFAARKIWASFPGAGYDQREVPVAKLKAVYIQRGGKAA